MAWLLFAQHPLIQQLFSPAGLLVLAGLVVMIIFAVRTQLLRAYERKKSPAENIPKLKDLQRDSAITDAPVEVLRWEVEMHNTARDLKGELDSKILLLQAVIKEAQQERQRLEETIRQAEAIKRRGDS